MIVAEAFMCATNAIMNNSSSSSSPPPSSSSPSSPPVASSTSTDKNSMQDSEQDSHDDKTTNQILDVIFDYMATGDDELTLRFDRITPLIQRRKFSILSLRFRRGSKLEVLSTDESISGSRGWWTGRLVDSDSVGIFPANFVADSAAKLRIIDYNDLKIGETIGVGGFG